MATVESIAELIKHWQSTGVLLNPGASLEQISATEKVSGLRIPDGLRMLYQQANGMAEGESDSQLFYFWPVERLGPERKEWGVPNDLPILLFGDFLMASHAYGVLCDGADLGSVHIFHGPTTEKVADSLDSFFTAVVKDPDSVHLLGDNAV